MSPDMESIAYSPYVDEDGLKKLSGNDTHLIHYLMTV